MILRNIFVFIKASLFNLLFISFAHAVTYSPKVEFGPTVYKPKEWYVTIIDENGVIRCVSMPFPIREYPPRADYGGDVLIPDVTKFGQLPVNLPFDDVDNCSNCHEIGLYTWDGKLIKKAKIPWIYSRADNFELLGVTNVGIYGSGLVPKSSAVPEPMSMSLLTVGLLGGLIKRKLS